MPTIPPGFLKAILENPDEDVHRLALADWLLDHGHPARSECVRAGCKLAAARRSVRPILARCERLRRRGRPVPDELRRRLAANDREQAAGQHALPPENPEWFLPLAPGLVGLNSFTTHCGFVEKVCCEAEFWLTNGDAIRASNPLLLQVLLTTKPGNTGHTELPALRSGWPGIDFRFTWELTGPERRQSRRGFYGPNRELLRVRGKIR
jgi:uncharacterized protein (TIGR02996 family)